MRHLSLLAVGTLIMAICTSLAWQWDQARTLSAENAAQAPLQHQINTLEHQYLSTARALLAQQNAADPLLNQIDHEPAEWKTLTSIQERDAAFQTLASKVRARLLTAPSNDAATLQEWRRTQDIMNGALHRRDLLIEQIQALN